MTNAGLATWNAALAIQPVIQAPLLLKAYPGLHHRLAVQTELKHNDKH